MAAMLTHVSYQSFSKLRFDRLLWRLDSRRLRILCYHGICEDALERAPWMPHFFVTRSAFEAQLRYLRREAVILPLREAVERLADGSLPPRAVSLTFDDGYANNLRLGGPLLEAYGAHATVFLSTAYIESGELLPFLKLKLIRDWVRGSAGTEAPVLAEYKSNPLDVVVRQCGEWWPRVEPGLSEEQRRALRPLSIAEVRRADSRWIEFGAHGHTHCILKNEAPERRAREIRTSVARLADWTGRTPLFSYPNGQRGDFNETDQAVLRSAGVPAAVSGIPGANGRGTGTYELKRYPVGMYHDDAGFRSEVTGFRTALLAAGRGAAS